MGIEYIHCSEFGERNQARNGIVRGIAIAYLVKVVARTWNK